MEYIIVTVTFENIGNKTISYNMWDFSMSNSLDIISTESLTGVNLDTILGEGELLPGYEATGTLAYEQPINDLNLVLYHTQSIFSDSAELMFKLN